MDRAVNDLITRMMTQHSYSLQRYAGKRSRHTCPSCGGRYCFTRYVDENGEYLGDEVGRCDHESSCGYHYKPKDWFRDHPDSKHDWRELTPEEKKRLFPEKPKRKPLCTIPDEYVKRSVRPDKQSHLMEYLSRIIDPLVLEGLIVEYRIGVTKAKETIFFQIDKDGRCRTGKVMKYNPETGRRIKDDKTPSKITWVHSLLKQQGLLKQDWELSQCLFGEHLLNEYPDSKVALVESEKTAIICAAIMPRFIWLATGGKTQLGDKLEVLRGREVVAFPDIDAYDTWQEKLCSLPFLNVIISDYLIKNATPQDIENHIDIADLLLREKAENHQIQQKHPILKYFSEEWHEEVRKLIEDFELIAVSVKRLE